MELVPLFSSLLKSILKVEGYRGLTRGLVPTLARDVPFSGLYLMFYEHLKAVTPREVKDLQPSAVHFLSGLVAGVLASLVTQPADVVKTELQLARGQGRRVLNTAADILRRQGLSGFTTGFVPRALRRTMMAALAWTVYEKMIKSIGLK